VLGKHTSDPEEAFKIRPFLLNSNHMC